MKVCYPLSTTGLKLFFCFVSFLLCRGLNLTCVVHVLSMSVVFVVVIQWPTSTNMKPSCNAILYSYPFSMSCTCKSFEFAEISQKKFKTIQLKQLLLSCYM